MDWVVLGQQVWFGLLTGSIYVVFASGLALAFGVMGIINLAHGELCMLGAMVTYTLITYLGMNFLEASALCIVLVGAFAIVVNRVAIQPLVFSPLAVLLSTLALSYILMHGGVGLWTANPRIITPPFAGVFEVADVRISQQSIMVLVLAALAMVALHLLLTKTRLGKVIQATSQSIKGAHLVGIDIKRAYDYTLIITGALAALAGILLAIIRTAHPSMGQPLLLVGFVVVIVGGMGNIPGITIVGLAIGILEALFAQYLTPYFRWTFIYGIMIVILLLKPMGLFARK